ncbi:hypothetical protein TNCV_776451 [Trichonephila clavipes]|nr:hypothetical protein TNCV_776451 [Trichonephila clavipes]
MGEVVVVENSLKNRTLWSLARVIQLIPGKDGHVRVARVKTETGELVRPVQRLYNLELQEPEITLPKDLTDSVIRTRRGRKVFFYSRKTQRWENAVKAPKSEGVVDLKSGAVASVILLKEDETDQAKEEPAEIMHINDDFENSDEHETKGKISNAF